MNSTYDFIGKLIAFAVFLQGFELLMIRRSWSDQGMWPWKILKSEYTERQQKFLSFFLDEKHFLVVVIIQIILALLNLYYSLPAISGVLLLTVILTAARFRGTFNGGSDYMTVLILLAHFFGGISGHKTVQAVFLWYIAVQTVLSYFLAGMAKLREKEWRSGVAISKLLTYSNYVVSENATKLSKNPILCKMASIILLVFECTFPLAILDWKVCFVYLTVGFFFHLENYLDLGLNRFFFAWIAAYPAVFYLSH